MKTCFKCGTIVNDDILFCPKCGKVFDRVMSCQYCGKEISVDSTICPYCGAPQSKEQESSENKPNEEPTLDQDISNTDEGTIEREPETPKSETKKHPSYAGTLNERNKKSVYIWGIFGVLSIFLIGAFFIFLFTKNDDQSNYTDTMPFYNNEVGTDVEMEVTKTIGNPLEERIHTIFSEGLKLNESSMVNTFFSKGYREMINKVDSFDLHNLYLDGPGYFNGPIVFDLFSNEFDVIIDRIYNQTQNEADADIIVTENSGLTHNETFHFKLEDGDWFIDNTDAIESMEEYLNGLYSFNNFLEENPEIQVNLFEDSNGTPIVEIIKDGFISRFENEPSAHTKSIHILDINFDGEADIFVGSDGRMSQNSLYVYNPSIMKYERYENDNDLQCSIFINPYTKEIYTGVDESFLESIMEKRVWENGKMVCVESLLEINDIKEYKSFNISAENDISTTYTLYNKNKDIISRTNDFSDLPTEWKRLIESSKARFKSDY